MYANYRHQMTLKLSWDSVEPLFSCQWAWKSFPARDLHTLLVNQSCSPPPTTCRGESCQGCGCNPNPSAVRPRNKLIEGMPLWGCPCHPTTADSAKWHQPGRDRHSNTNTNPNPLCPLPLPFRLRLKIVQSIGEKSETVINRKIVNVGGSVRIMKSSAIGIRNVTRGIRSDYVVSSAPRTWTSHLRHKL